MEKEEVMKMLLEVPSPSGEEKDGIEVWNQLCEKIPNLTHCYQDKMGNSAWSWGNGKTKILISGHIDEISMAVTGITDDGYLLLGNMGGVDKKTLPGNQVVIVTDEELVTGMIVSTPIHIQYSEKNQDEVFNWEDLRVDIGAETKEEVTDEFKINIGTPVIHKRNIWTAFGKHKLVGNALDDKSGVYCVLNVLDKLGRIEKNNPLWEKVTVIGMAFTGEESGLRGAGTATKNINPDISIDLDVTHAQFGVFSKDKYGDIKLGKGPVITYGNDKSRRLSNELKKIAEENKIPYQLDVCRAGGTNTDMIQMTARDCETTLVSIPLTSMHTPNETMDWRDIEATVDLLEKFILKQE